ncbi:carboxypeptidase-like regulatory domain-containing protein [Cohnella nanjingensis]|uniref:Carboxypeptidase regulatory-like domain-containing protein n=1 Tax=Cohnella nanjingensis TaxID=1387779 RepID=A0A7X0VEH5_9BACL|nr:carboxypeptidase-like regulatory domain-containing protein [Cohnella nanjingensis]MBB6671017.1 carboxypeptidase regulatory-like domain-containing protein [Cohnella nanjingensis]
MRSISKTAVLALLAAGLAGCTGQSNNQASPSASPSASATATASQMQGQEARLDIEQTTFSLKQWKVDGSHNTSVKGKFMIGDQPVANAVLHAGTSKKNIVTGDDGSFELLVDQSLLSDTPVRVVSLDEAKVGGQPLNADAANQVKDTSTYISVYYPIEVSEVKASASDANQVEVHGQIKSGKDDLVSFFQIDKYRIGGKVIDADGNPVKDAVVWIDRDEGEGFAKSTPTDENGNYQLFYLPEDEETNLTVTIGTKRYTLPENKVYIIPEDTSVEINITLPKEGTVIDDKPPTLVSKTSKGAMYTGVLAGLNVPEDVKYTVTIPDKEGHFVLTVPKAAWDQHPSFFETKMTKFVDQDDELAWGDTLPSSFVQPGANDPKNIESVSKGA